MFGLKRLYIYTRDRITCLIACYNKFIIDSDGLILCLYFQITLYNAGRPDRQPCLCWYIFHFESSIVRPNFLIEFPAHNFIHLLYRERGNPVYVGTFFTLKVQLYDQISWLNSLHITLFIYCIGNLNSRRTLKRPNRNVGILPWLYWMVASMSFYPNFTLILSGFYPDLRTEVRGDFNIHGTRYF